VVLALGPQLSVFFGAECGFSTLLNGACDESADAFAYFFSSLGDRFVSRTVQIAGNAVREPLPWPTTFAPVALLRHNQILTVSC